MKKYIHKNTGIIGELNEDCHIHFKRIYGNVCSNETIHMDFVINSNDWEEFKKPEVLFITEDNIELVNLEQRVFGVLPKAQWQTNFSVNQEGLTIDRIINKAGNKPHSWLWFSSKEKASEYVLLNKPTISINDFLNFVEDKINKPSWKYGHTTEKVLEKLKELVNSKL